MPRPAKSFGQWTHPVFTEIRNAVDQALLGPTRPEGRAPRDLGRAREEAHEAQVRLPAPAKPTFKLQERYLRRYGLFVKLFAFPGLFFLMGLALAVPGAWAAVGNVFAKIDRVASGVSAVVLIGFTLWLCSYFVMTLRFWLFAPARVVPYFERRLDSGTKGAFKNGFALAQRFDELERRASQLGVPPLSAFGFGDDVLGQLVVWHATEAGLKTVQALVASSHSEALHAKLLEDLRALEAALERAEAKAVRFALVVRIGADKWISGAEMSQRKGSFF